MNIANVRADSATQLNTNNNNITKNKKLTKDNMGETAQKGDLLLHRTQFALVGLLFPELSAIVVRQKANDGVVFAI